jgi:hypothetical protein
MVAPSACSSHSWPCSTAGTWTGRRRLLPENLQACAEAFYGDEARLAALMATVAVRADEEE